MKKYFLLAAISLVALSSSRAQYKFDASFPNASKEDSVLIVPGGGTYGMHGVAVGLDGNIWTVNYNTYIKGDSLMEQGTHVVKAVLPLRIFKPDGTPASFSPLMILKGAGIADTLFKGGIKGGTEGGTGRGLSTTPDGNIVFTWFSSVYVLDYRTGAVLSKCIAACRLNHGNTAAATDVAGNIFTGPVFPMETPIEVWNKNGVKLGNIVDWTASYSRTLTCSRAGDKVYFAGYTGNCIIRYTGNVLTGFTADTLLKGFACESLCRSGKTDLLWASAGSGNDLPNQYPGVKTFYSPHTWYLYDPATDKIKDSIQWNGASLFSTADFVALRPRGVATTMSGDTVYVCMFGSKVGMYNVQRFIKQSLVTPTNEWMSFWSDSSYFDGRPLTPGDVVEAFDPQGVRCGAFVVKEFGRYGLMPVYRDDASTTIDEGAQPGDVITFKINGYAANVSGPENAIWTSNGDTKKIHLVTIKTRTVALVLKKNWNLVSWNVDTPADGAASLFAPIVSKLSVALGFDGGGLTYDPTIPAEFITLKTADHLHGYWLKMKEAGTLSVTGRSVEKNTPIALKEGYNLISYIPEKADSTRHALASVIGNAFIVLGYDEGGLTYDPAIPDAFNTLKTLRPGSGYWIKMKSAGTLTYPAASMMPAADSPIAPIDRATAGDVGRDVTPTREWMSAWGTNLSLNGQLIQSGTLITAKTERGVVCGSATAWADGKFGLMPIYKDDPSTDQIEGAQENEAIELTIGTYRVPKTIAWSDNGAVINIADVVTGIAELSRLPMEFLLRQNYPNPFNPTTTIEYQLPKAARVTLRVFDALGRDVACLVSDHKEAGYYQVQWNAAGQSSGVYFCTISAGEFHKTMKLQLVK